MSEENQELDTPPEGVVTPYKEVIDGLLYETETLTATTGLVILPKLIRLVGEEGMTLMMGTSDKELDSLTKNPEVVAAMVSTIAEKAADTNGLLIVKDLLRKTSCEKVRIGENFIKANVYDNFDTHFAGKYMHLMNVAMWVARCSFGGP